MMEYQFLMVFIISFLSLVHGYTPTFRNEATHPLKAPTESTLQMNEESSGRTNSNIQKHDTYLSGGKHFEYMLLNGSNVLLTSLQNDNPYNNPVEQVVSPKPELFTKTDLAKNNTLVENTSRNKTYLVTKPSNSSSSWNKTTPVRNNYTAITKLKSNHNSTWFSVNTMPEQSVTKFSVRRPDFRKFEKPNISSPTRLYSKYENKSNENFASFTSPIVAKPVVSIYSDGSIPEMEEKPVHKETYDYDDSFTKLLISNGILKPDNKEGWNNIQDTSSSSVAPSTEKMYSKVPKKFNGNSITNMPNNSLTSTYTQILKDRRPAVGNENLMSSPNVTTAPQSAWNENNVTYLPIESHSQESSTKDLAVDSVQAGIPNQHELSTKSSAGITSNSIGDLNVDESPREASAESNTLSIITNKSRTYTYIEKQLKPYTLPIVKKNYFPDTMIFDDLVQNDNSAKPFNAKNLTHDEPVKMSVKSYSNKVEDQSNENSPQLRTYFSKRRKYPNSNSIEAKITREKRKMDIMKNHTALKFKNLVEKSIQQLFLPVAKFFSNNKENLPGNFHLNDKVKNFKTNVEDSKDLKVTLKSFEYTNLLDVLRNNTQHLPSIAAQLLRVYREVDVNPSDTVFNWTNLDNDENFKFEDTLNDLFAEDDEIHWFVILLDGNSTIAEMRKAEFLNYLRLNLAARLSLEYNDIKINGIIVVPPNLVVNVSFPFNFNEYLEKFKDEIQYSDNPNTYSIRQLAETNTTLLELSGQEYHVLQLLSLKSHPQFVQNSLPQTARVIDRKHDDIEFYIFLIVGAICMFAVISPILYTLYRLIQKRLTTYTFKMPDVFRDKMKPPPHEKINESTCESLNVIFSEDFDRKYSSTSWFDNTQHSSSILKPSSDVPPVFFVPKDESFTDFCDITRNPIENSPRLSKENKLNMLGCRPSCVLLPHQGRYQIDSEYDPEKYFDNPNYSHEAR